MAIFLTVVLTVYFLANLYLYLKGRRALSGAGLPVTAYTVIFLLLASAFVAGKILEHSYTASFPIFSTSSEASGWHSCYTASCSG